MWVEKILIFFVFLLAVAAPTVMIAILADKVIKATARNPGVTTKMYGIMLTMLVILEIVIVISILAIVHMFSR